MNSDIARAIDAALEEDLSRGDPTSEIIDPSHRSRGTIVAKAELVVCGLEVAQSVFQRVDASLECSPILGDGHRAEVGATIARVAGSTRSLLAAERTALNFVGHLSGIATLTAKYVEAVRGTRARILDTRKTTPGLRTLEKYAVRTGGGENHRMDLGEAMLIKDNHVRAAGGVSAAVLRARGVARPQMSIEVEVTTLAELNEALSVGATRILLDNMDLGTIAQAVRVTAGRATLEVSGGVTLDRVRALAETGVDLISIGRLTHSAPWADVSLDLE